MSNCAWCKRMIWSGQTEGVSSIYSPDREFILCEPCWLAEDELIDEVGTNDLPDQLAIYRRAG